MLRIKNDCNLQELEQYGFTKSLFYENNYVKKVYLKNDDDDKNFYIVDKFTRKIRLTRLDGELDNTLYDLIQARISRKNRRKEVMKEWNLQTKN